MLGWQPPNRLGANVPSSRSNRQAATIAIQTLLGVVCFGIWAVSELLTSEDPTQVFTTVLPYFIFFELGIFSRYIPCVRSAANKLDMR